MKNDMFFLGDYKSHKGGEKVVKRRVKVQLKRPNQVPAAKALYNDDDDM